MSLPSLERLSLHTDAVGRGKTTTIARARQALTVVPSDHRSYAGRLLPHEFVGR